jgi:hypothetical protein
MIMFIIFPRRYQLRRITVDGSSCRFLTYCCRFVFSTFLPHPPHYHHVVLFWFRSRRCLIGIVVAGAFIIRRGPQVLFFICMGAEAICSFCIGATNVFLLYPWEGRTLSVPFVVFKRGGEGGCRRKAKVRFLSFSSTRQLYGAPPSLQRLIQYKYCLKDTECAWKLKSHRSYFGSIYFAARYCFVLSFNLPQQQ